VVTPPAPRDHPPPHAMWREIREQPSAIAATLRLYVEDGTLRPEFLRKVAAWLASSRDIVIAASGSSRHAALHGKALIESLARITTHVVYASEYGMADVCVPEAPAVLVVSQSGETADTLAALRGAIAAGHRTLAITNVPNSSMACTATVALQTVAGPEQAVPATKSFATQLLLMHLIALAAATLRGVVPEEGIAAGVRSLALIPQLLEMQLQQDWSVLTTSAERCLSAAPLVFLGRGLQYALAREGALKIKETAYIPAEAMPAGELKHGPIAMLGNEASLVVLATRDPADPGSVQRYRKTLQLLEELKTRDIDVLTIASQDDARISSLSSRSVATPPVSEAVAPFMALVPLQLLAYEAAVKRGVDVDRPRHLVKSLQE